VLGADGTVETITGTTIHPVWSVDRQEWVPLAELAEGETLQGLDGLAVVLSVTLSRVSKPVYNIEVHGEHVYQVGELGLVVHNACSSTSGNNAAAALGQKMHRKYKAGLADGTHTFKEYIIKGTRKKIDFLDIENGIIYELKPNNTNAIAKGFRQASGYAEELKKLFPNINWKIIVDTY
jgi:hypothetical protein